MTKTLLWDKRTVRRTRLAARLRRLGYDVTVPSSPEDFMAHLDGLRPRLVLLSPAAAKTKAPVIRTRLPEATIIGFTSARDDDVKTFCDLDVDSFFTLPLGDNELECRIQSTLRRSDATFHGSEEWRRLEAMVAITSLTSSTLEPAEILFHVVRKISELVPVTRCSIIRIDKGARSGVVVASFEDAGITGIHIDLGNYPEIREALERRRPVLVNDVSRDPLMEEIRDMLSPLGIRSIMVLPIRFRDEVIGTLFLRTSMAGREFTKHEISLCEAVANASSNALHNAFIFERMKKEKHRLEHLAITDYLTGIYNIRYFYHRLEAEFARAERYEIPLACLMMDIDFFKRINDTFGHRKGDDVLREFAQVLRDNTRSSDILARYGGEEFILLLPQTDLPGAVTEGERLRKLLGETRFSSVDRELSISVSLGLAVFPHEKITTSDRLISSADEALYQAKHSGRNCLTVFS